MQTQYARNYPLAAQAAHHAPPTRRGPGTYLAPAPNKHPAARPPAPTLPDMIRKADLEHMFRKPAPVALQNQYPPPQQPHHGNAQIIQAQKEEQKRRDLLRSKAKQPTNKNVPDGIEDLCIGDAVARYKDLRDVERTLDATMMRKKLEASDSVNHLRTSRTATLRIWISNTAENQPWQTSQMDPDAFDFESDTNATYRVKIQGRLLDEGGDEGLEEEDDDDKDPDAMEEDPTDVEKKKDAANKPKPFSQFFTSVTIDFDRAKSLQPDNFTQIEWKRPEGAQPQDNPFSQIEFERKSDENINITINLHRYQNPETFRLSKPMAELLDTDEEDRAGVLMGVWEYARSQNLQQDDDERKFACDSKLKALFNGADSFYFPALPGLIKPHLTTLPPIQLQYTIRVDKDYIAPSPESGKRPSEPTVYDVRVALDDPLQPLLHSIIRSKQSTETLKEIQTIDEQIVLLMSALGRSKAKHAFFTSMATDPVAFVNRWFSSQKRDLEVIMGDSARGGGEDAEEWRSSGPESVWGTETARESVALWLARQSIPKTH